MITIFALSTGFFWFSLYAYVPELSTYADALGSGKKRKHLRFTTEDAELKEKVIVLFFFSV